MSISLENSRTTFIFRGQMGPVSPSEDPREPTTRISGSLIDDYYDSGRNLAGNLALLVWGLEQQHISQNAFWLSKTNGWNRKRRALIRRNWIRIWRGRWHVERAAAQENKEMTRMQWDHQLNAVRSSPRLIRMLLGECGHSSSRQTVVSQNRGSKWEVGTRQSEKNKC